MIPTNHPNPMNTTEDKTITVGDWIITLILLAIPVVNFIMLIVWAVSDTTPLSKRNYAKASLILLGVMIGLAIVFGILAAVLGIATSHPAR
jgi:hypothetical protein